MAKIRWMKSALEDLADIVRYIKRGSPHYAALFKAKVFDLVKNLEGMPYIGRKVPEFNDDSTREILYKEYRIIYRVIDDTIEIVTVIHGRRLLKP